MDSIFKHTENNGEAIITGLQRALTETSIFIPETINGIPVVEIGPEAFRSTSITDIKIGANIKKIGEKAFYMCNKLRSVTWSHKCDVIPVGCFFGCSNLMQFDFSGIKKIGGRAFYESGLQEVCLTENTEVVSKKAFSCCKILRTVIWNCKCNVIPVECFVRCSNLTKFDFSSVKRIEAYAFWRSGLTSVTLSKKTEVDQNCFAYCNDLEKIEWLSGRAIKDSIFEGCKHIKEIFISDSVKNIEASAFASSPNAEITFV